MNKYELVYDLKEHLDTYSQTYDDYIMSYGEADMIYHYIEEKDKEIKRLTAESTKWESKFYDEAKKVDKVIHRIQLLQMDGEITIRDLTELVNILKGSDK